MLVGKNMRGERDIEGKTLGNTRVQRGKREGTLESKVLLRHEPSKAWGQTGRIKI